MHERCTECGGELVFNPDGELVCSKCGLVQKRNMQLQRDFIKNRVFTRGYVPEPLELGTFLKPSLSPGNTLVKPTFRKKLSRISKLNLYSKAAGDRSMYYRIYKTLSIVTEKLGLPHYLLEHAYILYIKMFKKLKNKSVNGKINHYRLSAACLIAAARTNNLNVTINEILKIYQNLGHRVTKSNLLEIITILQSEGVYKIIGVKDRTERLIPLMLRKIFLDKTFVKNIKVKNIYMLEKRIANKAKQLLYAVDSRKIQGRNPYVLALAFIYIAFINIYGNKGISQGYLSRKFGFSLSAIRNNIRFIFKTALLQ